MLRFIIILLICLVLMPACEIPTNPLHVILATPGNGSTTQSLSPVMTWVGLPDNAYHLEISTDSGFNSLAVKDTHITQLLFAVPSGKLSSATTYFWRVRATRSGQTGPWSTAWYFITPGSTPTPPTPPPDTTGTINIATLANGVPWSGAISYTIAGPVTVSGTLTPQTFSNLPAGQYTLTYNSGGPSGSILEKISPAGIQVLSAGGYLTFNINLRSQVAGSTIQFNALLDGQPWSGAVNYTITGPMTGIGYQVPKTSYGLIPGTYTVTYNSGGPSGATLTAISPAATEVLSPGQTTTFTFVFRTQQPSYGIVHIRATLDGAPWEVAVGSAMLNYNLIGPATHSGSTIPTTYEMQPAGTYTMSFSSGGPHGSVLTSITPSGTQTLTHGGAITFTLNFSSQARGTVHVTATLNGEPWSGSVSYVVHGPYTQSGSYVTQSFSNAPTGTYSVSYSSGGPPSSVFEGITPSSQILPAGGSINFNIHFKFQGLR